MLRDFGLTSYEYARDNLRYVKKALEEMIEKRVIRGYTVEEIFDANRKNKLVDAIIVIKPDLNFANQTIRANIKQREVKQLTGKFKP